MCIIMPTSSIKKVNLNKDKYEKTYGKIKMAY